MRRFAVTWAALMLSALVPAAALAEPISMKLLSTYSRVTFKADAPLETINGNTAGPGVVGTLTLDPTKPQDAKGTIKVDMDTVSSGVDKRDSDMRTKFLDTGAGDANRWVVFEIKSVDVAGALQPGKEATAKVTGILTIKGVSVEREVAARVTYIKLTPEQVEGQKRFGFTTDNIKVRARFGTTLTNHKIKIPQLLFLKLANALQLEADLTFVRQ